MTSDDLLKRADEALGSMTRGKPVQFSPQYCDEAKGTKYTEWDTSHDLSVIREDGSRYRIGTFRHADDALFDQMARDLLPEMAARIRELEAERDRLREALEPLHDAARDRASDAPEWNDRTTVSIWVTIGDLRRARAALQTDTGGKADG